MPYGTINDLPSTIRRALPQGAQAIYKSAFNSGLKTTESESQAAQIAWSAVKKSYQKVGSKWEKK